MFKSLVTLMTLSSCAYLGLISFDSTNKGLQKLLVHKSSDIKKCSEQRPPWHQKLSYRVKVSLLINKEGEREKTYVQSLPALGHGMKRCLISVFDQAKFEPTKNRKAKKLVQVFKIKSL